MHYKLLVYATASKTTSATRSPCLPTTPRRALTFCAPNPRQFGKERKYTPSANAYTALSCFLGAGPGEDTRIATALVANGYTVTGTDLIIYKFGTIVGVNPSCSFITCTYPLEHPFAGDYTACNPPEETQVIVTNIPFSLKLLCLLRAVELGLPFYSVMPMACFVNKGVYDLLKENNAEVFVVKGKQLFYKPAEDRDVNVGTV